MGLRNFVIAIEGFESLLSQLIGPHVHDPMWRYFSDYTLYRLCPNARPQYQLDQQKTLFVLHLPLLILGRSSVVQLEFELSSCGNGWIDGGLQSVGEIQCAKISL